MDEGCVRYGGETTPPLRGHPSTEGMGTWGWTWLRGLRLVPHVQPLV
ncbi:MAG: hypothetical protein LBM98_00625 [Oscillospiraceae bacterium]|nr:hypothetical protein [Oscillospiraceae bacterium]